MHRFLKKNERYVLTKHVYEKNIMNKLANGQSPKTLLVTCSDSRLMPTDFTMSGPGELFILRNAGNTVCPYDEHNPPKDALTIEYGIEILNIREIVICGHQSCGAIQGLLSMEALRKYPSIYSNLKELALLKDEPHIKRINDPSEKVDAMIRYNLKLQIDNLLTYPFIRNRWLKGEIKIFGMVFDFVTGKFSFDMQVTPESIAVRELSQGA
jgi:carbonic anhydrase